MKSNKLKAEGWGALSAGHAMSLGMPFFPFFLAPCSRDMVEETRYMLPSENPLDYGLSKRVVLKALGSGLLALVLDRKSRIVMADGRKIMEKVNAIRQNRPDLQLVLLTSAPVCSKTMAFLAESDVKVEAL